MKSKLYLIFNQSSQAISVFLGCILISLVFFVYLTENEPFEVFNMATSILGSTFILLISLLTFFSIICITNVININFYEKKLWFETGIQLSNLISTIALTYTLLGISLGIGELSSSKLDVDTINETISKLTEQFSMAFMTSVVGLPLSGVLRSILIICYEYNRKYSNLNNQQLIGKS